MPRTIINLPERIEYLSILDADGHVDNTLLPDLAGDQLLHFPPFGKGSAKRFGLHYGDFSHLCQSECAFLLADKNPCLFFCRSVHSSCRDRTCSVPCREIGSFDDSKKSNL